MDMASGSLYVHSAPRAVTNHIEWAVNGLIGAPQRFRWRQYESAPSFVKLSLHWEAHQGFAVALASALRGWSEVRFEITEDPSLSHPGVLVMHTPGLGLFTGEINHAGSLVLCQERLGELCSTFANQPGLLTQAIRDALGEEWEKELEPYRSGEAPAGTANLYAVG